MADPQERNPRRRIGNPRDLAHKTLERLDELGLTPTPQAYHVIYAFLNQEIPDLVKLVQVLMRNTREFNDEMVGKVYDKFFGVGRHSARIAAGVEGLQAAVEKVEHAVDTVIEESRSYGSALDEGNQRLSADDITIDEARAISAGLSQDTVRMRTTSENLKGGLHSYHNEIAQVKRELEEVRRQAMTDTLTGIANRKLFEATLHEEAAAAMETGERLSLLMIDIDSFKEFNDSHGHRAGDGVLKQVARVLTNSTKGADTVARYGGEEFAIILPNTDLDNAALLAENIRKRVASSRVRNKKTGEDFGQLTVSIGAALFHFGETLADFVERADKALYAAKQAGRNRVARSAS